MVAACLELKDGRVHDARVAVGACSEVARRLNGLEARLEDTPAGEAPDMVLDEDFASLSPLDDVRASAPYRRHGARVLVRRALDALVRGEEPYDEPDLPPRDHTMRPAVCRESKG